MSNYKLYIRMGKFVKKCIINVKYILFEKELCNLSKLKENKWYFYIYYDICFIFLYI